jgi:DNA-binding LytR/AlgR family response regulator
VRRKAELETPLNPARFVRIHRGVILNLDHLLDLHADFGGRMVARCLPPGDLLDVVPI